MFKSLVFTQAVTFISLISITAFAIPQKISVSGRIVSSNTNLPLNAPNVLFKLKVIGTNSPQNSAANSQECVLYSEDMGPRDMTNSDGAFDINLGEGTVSYPSSMQGHLLEAFNNSAPLTCENGLPYNPAPTDGRLLRVSFFDGMSWQDFSPDTAFTSVPYAGFAGNANSAEMLGSNVASDFLLKAGLPTCAAGTFLTWNGNALICNAVAGASGGTLNSVVAGAGLSGGGVGTAGSVTLSLPNVGAVGTYAKVTTDAQGRVVAGVALTSADIPALDASKITSGVITKDVNATNVGGVFGSFSNLRIFDSSNSQFLAMNFPGGGGSYTLNWPNASGTKDQILQTDGSGNLSWQTLASGTVTSITGSAPISILNATSNPTISIAQANSTTSGFLQNSDWNTFNNKQTSSLPFSNIWVGSAFGTATSVVPSGDISMTNSGSFNVTKIQGTALSTTTPISPGQVLRFSGTQWMPNFISITDLRSNITGASQFTNSCNAGQTLTYSAVSDMMICSNIAISNSQVAGLGTAAMLNVGISAENIIQLDSFSKLPPVNGSMLTNLDANKIASGTLPSALGGTGLSSYQVGDLLYASSANSLSRLPSSINGYVLTSNGAGAAPTWSASPWALSSGNISFTSGNLGIGTTTPSSLLHLSSSNITSTEIRIDNTSVGGRGFVISSTGSSANGGVGAFQILDAANFGPIFSTAGPRNLFAGPRAALTNTPGPDNVGLGAMALNSVSAGYQNTAMGSGAAASTANSVGNTAVGFDALHLLGNGAFNTAVGSLAGATPTSGFYNTYIGYGADALNTGTQNSTAIGNGAKITASGQIVLGNSNIMQVIIPSATANLGIGTSTPVSALNVHNGAIVTDTVNNIGNFIDFTKGNVQVSSSTATSISICGLKDGGTYTLVLTGLPDPSDVSIFAYPTYVDSVTCSGTPMQVDLGAGSAMFTSSGLTNILSFVFIGSRGPAGTVYGVPATNYNY